MVFLGTKWALQCIECKVLVLPWEKEFSPMLGPMAVVRIRVFSLFVFFFGLRPLWGMVKGSLGWGFPCILAKRSA